MLEKVRQLGRSSADAVARHVESSSTSASTVNPTAQRLRALETTLLHPHTQWTVKAEVLGGGWE
eukprot:639564-Prymnesium_polylepis.2